PIRASAATLAPAATSSGSPTQQTIGSSIRPPTPIPLRILIIPSLVARDRASRARTRRRSGRRRRGAQAAPPWSRAERAQTGEVVRSRFCYRPCRSQSRASSCTSGLRHPERGELPGLVVPRYVAKKDVATRRQRQRQAPRPARCERRDLPDSADLLGLGA